MNTHSILVAEDDDVLRREIGVFLQSCGFHVTPVGDGYQALDWAVHHCPDLLILDVHMPAGDGFSVYDRVSKLPQLALKPIIYMTSDRSHRIEEMAERHGGFTLLHKPFEMDVLLKTVERALGESGAEAA